WVVAPPGLEPDRADITGGLNRLREPSEVAKGQTPCLFSRESSRAVQLDLAFQMVAELLRDLVVNLTTAEKATKRRDETADHRPSRSTRRIDSANVSQVSVSLLRRFRPTGVMV